MLERPQKSVLRAYLYLLLLGYVGGHRFYMRKGGSAIFMAVMFVAGVALFATGMMIGDVEVVYLSYIAGVVVASMMLVDLVMIPGMIEDLNDPGEDRRMAVIAGNLDPSFQATMRRAGREDDPEKPRKSALGEDYQRPWKQQQRETKTYRPDEDD